MKGINYFIIFVIVAIALCGVFLLNKGNLTGRITGEAVYGDIQDDFLNESVIWDSYVQGGLPNTNFGTNADLLVKWGSPKDRTYAMFDISGIPADKVIEDAQACFYLYNDQGDHNVSIYHVYTWNGTNETTLTWNNEPCGEDFDNVINCNLTAEDTINTDGNQDETWQCWNVTNIVNYEYTQDKDNVSFSLTTPNNGNADKYYSKDYTDNVSLRPYLNITYSSSNIAPIITLISPEATLYTENESLNLTFIVEDEDENLDSCWYNIDDGNNITITDCDNTTFSVADSASYILMVFANDSEGLESSDSVSFDVDATGVAVSITQPTGTKTSRTNIPVQYNVVGSNVTCWYNVKTSIGGSVIDNTTLVDCGSSSFNVSVDGDYVLNLFANNTLGSSDFDSSSFSIDTSSDNGGSSSGGGSRTTIVQPNLTTNLTLAPLLDIIVNPGEPKKIKLIAKNTGTSFLNDCMLESTGKYSPWIKGGEIKDISAGEEYEFIFDIKSPEDAKAGKYEMEVNVICKEINKKIEFFAEILDKKIEFNIKNVEREGSDKIKIIYSLKELSGIKQNLELEFLLVDESGRKVLEAIDERTLEPNSEGEFITKIVHDKILEGGYKLLVNINSETYSAFIQEDVLLSPVSGFSVFGESIENTDTFISIMVITAFIVFAFFSIKRTLMHKKKIKEKSQ